MSIGPDFTLDDGALVPDLTGTWRAPVHTIAWPHTSNTGGFMPAPAGHRLILLETGWINPYPRPMRVFPNFHFGGATIRMAVRNWLRIETRGAVVLGSGALPASIEYSRIGAVLDAGTVGSPPRSIYTNTEITYPATTIWIGPIAGTIVQPNQLFKARVEVEAYSNQTDNAAPDGGSAEVGNSYAVGPARLDFMAVML